MHSIAGKNLECDLGDLETAGHAGIAVPVGLGSFQTCMWDS